MNISKKQIDRIERNSELIKAEIAKIHQTLAVNTESLKDHMRRTEIAEKTVQHILDDRLPPIKSVTDKIKFVVKLVPWILGVAGAIAAIVHKTGISIF